MQPKIVLTLLTVDMYTINPPKHSSLVWAIMMDWTKRTVLLSLYFWVTKTVKYYVCFCVYCTVKLFLDTGEVTVKDPSGLAWFVRNRLSMLLGQELTEILSENKKSWLGKWILRREPWVALSKKIWDFQIINRTPPCYCIKRNWGKKNQDAYCHCTVKSATKKSYLLMKMFIVEETFN